MKNAPGLIAASMLALSFAALAAAHDQAKESSPHHGDASAELHRIMDEGSKMPMQMTGNTDRDFAMLMTMHHEQAIKMAEVELKHGENAELKSMAERMKASQEKEIKELAKHK